MISLAKLAPLVQRAAEVKRAGVAGRLANASAVKLILVRAPAGFGKTMAMVQIREALEDRGLATAWLTLDAADNDVPRFLAGLSAALGQMGLERGASAQDPLAQLVSEQTPYALFLDDFEVIREGGVLGLVRELLEQLPRNGQVIIGSRNLPDLGVGRLRARGLLLELETDSLRFSPSEAAEFFRLRGAELSLETLDRVLGKTEGWVAALWLLSLALQRSDQSSDVVARLSASDRDVADYLTEEVFSQQEPVVREFLLRTSVLHHLSAPVCQALLPQIDCDAMLQSLHRGNVFLIPVEDAPDLFRYHSLFADFLRRQLERERPDDAARLHLSASGWYESQQRPVPAIDHAIAGGDYPHALELLEHHAHGLLEQGRMRLLDRWFTTITPELLRARPRLQVIAVWARCFSQGPWTAMKWLEESGCQESDDPQVQAHVRALLPVLLAMMDRYEEAHEAGHSGLARLPTGNAFVDSVLLNAMAHILSVIGERKEAHRFLEDARHAQADGAFNRMYTETVGGMLDLREGHLRQATARFRMAVTATSSTSAYNYAHGNAWAGVPYAGALYEADDLVAAERLLNVYLPLARDVGLPDHMISSHRLRARLAFLRGEVDTAFLTLTELEYLGHQRQLPRVTASAKLERSRLLTLQGHAVAAREELARALALDALNSDTKPAQDVDDSFIAQMRLDLHAGDPNALVQPLEAQLRLAQQSGRQHRALKLRLFLALAFFRNGDVGRAMNWANPLLQETCREGFVRLLLDEGPIVAPLLHRMQSGSVDSVQDPILQEYVQRLADRLGPVGTDDEADTGHAESGPAEPLTRKEIRVLQLLAEGYSNTAMAEKLFISDSTVRTHLRNINTKLNSRSRTQAVAIARRLGIVR
ncbi:LuxR family transcriptional regulator [Burkholderia aenigmatica]|uniref:LuxR family transcriptional regulator n=1 Tax=Burkholderia aenigmatica TaxID=2015348 RepID=A0A6P2I1F1_9BURK|nr:LuxR C-terminal-related transcriptional regulator [Burkholderia aenigmatica]VWB23386.1 LuxR family transcriptional regulator [Burkholderia aenigmatica]